MMWLLTLWGGVKRLFGLAVAYPWQAALIIALAACAWLYAGKQGALADLADEQAAHIATKVNYANAQKVAADMNAKQVERIENEYAAIAAKSEKDYAKRIADNRATVDRWLRAKAASGVAGGSQASEAAAMSSGVVQGTDEAIVPVSDLLIVADAYAQLDALRAWAIEVGKVE
jgi:hypothetical protein